MRSKMYLLSLVLLFLLPTDTTGQPKKEAKTDTVTKVAPPKKDSKATVAKAKDTTNAKTEAQKAETDADPNKGEVAKSTTIILTVSILFFAVMLFLFYKFFNHVTKSKQYLGFQSIKLIGLILMFPGICIIAMAGDDLIEGSTLAALLGTIAGYVLSREDDAKTDNAKKEIATIKQEKDALQAKYNEMEAKFKKDIEELMKKIPKA